MREYESRKALTDEIRKTADLFIGEFEGIAEKDKFKIVDGVDRAPAEMIAYQLGWMDLILNWDRDEAAGKEVVTPAPGYKWNNLGGLYQSFYERRHKKSLAELRHLFREKVHEVIIWANGFSEDELFRPGGRRWAASTPSNWPVWKWIHINTAAPFKSFRAKIRKWKKLQAAG